VYLPERQILKELEKIMILQISVKSKGNISMKSMKDRKLENLGLVSMKIIMTRRKKSLNMNSHHAKLFLRKDNNLQQKNP
jgi:hypothetical protein